MEEASTTPKSGFKSSEFAATATVIAGVVTGAVNGALPPDLAALVCAGLAALYTLVRLAIKALHLRGRAANVPDLPELDAEK